MLKEQQYLIGIGGGTGSGKSTLAHELQRQLADQGACLISMDDYYLDQTDVPMEKRVRVNYDHPDSLDVDLLAADLISLKEGKKVAKPLYDFAEHTRKKQTEELSPVMWILVEGILTLHYEKLLQLFDVTIFVDTPADIRFSRRLSRDMVERQRSVDSVRLQYLNTVRPMHQQFVEPSQVNAEYVVSGEQDFEENIVHLLSNISGKFEVPIEIKPVEITYE